MPTQSGSMNLVFCFSLEGGGLRVRLHERKKKEASHQTCFTLKLKAGKEKEGLDGVTNQ